MILRTLVPIVALASKAMAQNPGDIKVVGNTLVGAMMMFLGNEEKVYILDKAEMNPVSINGHPAWGAVWDIATNNATLVNVVSNSFCASGMHFPNSSWASFGGNNAVSPGPTDYHGPGVDPVLQDVDGKVALRIVSPCTGDAWNFGDACQWFDDPTQLHMQTKRWYSSAEALGDGHIAIIGGMVNGGYINRPSVNVADPVTQGGQASNNFEFYPIRDPAFQPTTMQLLVDAGALNTYVHAYLMKSGKMFVQANTSAILWDPNTYEEDPMPEMPNAIVRVYPASGGAAMLPLTPDNNYTPTIIFCGGTNNFTNYEWGTYGGPNCNSWERMASNDCQRITPEPEDGSPVAYVQDDDMIDPRTMGQFVLLPDGTLLMINGARMGTAGYTTQTPAFPVTADLPFGESLATDPVLTPAIYDPKAPAGSRWSNAGLQASTIPLMYHSSALLLPDGSVLVAGSNPNADYNPQTFYSSETRAEIFYPLYWGKQRPVPTGYPTTITYGGDYFNMTLANGTYAGTPNVAAVGTKVVLIRTGFTTHAMTMGQRFLQLNSTYTVDDSGDITLHVSQHPANSNLLTPGPALLFVVVNGVPSMGKRVTVGSGNIEIQPLLDVAVLPPSTQSLAHAAPGSSSPSTGGGVTVGGHTFSIGAVIGAIAGGIAAAGLLAASVIFCCMRRRRQSKPAAFESAEPFANDKMSVTGAAAIGGHYRGNNTSAAYSTYSDMNLPLQQHAQSDYAQYQPEPYRAMPPSQYGSQQFSGSQQFTPPDRGQMWDPHPSMSSSAGGSPYLPPRDLEYDPYAETRRGGGGRI